MFFLGDIALMLELFGFCFSLVLLHKASRGCCGHDETRRENNGHGLVRAAGVILLIGSLVLAGCTSMGIYKRRAFINKEMMKDHPNMKNDHTPPNE